VCWDWNRILQDPGLKSPILEILEIIEKEKREEDLALKQTYSMYACQKLKPILFCLNQFGDWQKETAKLLAPFPIEEKKMNAMFLKRLPQLRHYHKLPN